jgi:hypothetical protein
MRQRFLVVLMGCLAASPALRAAVNDDIRTDSQRVAQWFSEQAAEIMTFQAMALPMNPGKVHDILGVEVGVSGGWVNAGIDTAEFRSLPLIAIDNAGTEISMDPDLPIPSWTIHAKLGLPKGFDLGLKFGGFDAEEEVSDAKSTYKSAVYGLEVRKKLLGGGVTGVALPDLCLSAAYDVASGDVTRTERYNAALKGGAGVLTANTSWKSEWDVAALTARLVASKKLLILTPYLGAGYTLPTGDAETTVTTVGTVAPATSISETAKGSADADGDIFHVVGGAEVAFFPFLGLNVGYLWSEDHWAAQAGLRFNFR